jgi:NADH-quinone oxidoreductase subunit H
MKLLFNYLIFPGFVFSAVIGLMACWVDRKVSARLQYRVGPPWHQNFTDILKLLGKEVIIPTQTKLTFVLAPFLGLLSLVLVADILGLSIISSSGGFDGDLIVVLYLLSIPAISLIIGASSSQNPLASVGASREIKLLLSYELPFILAVITIIVKSGGAIRLSEIIAHQQYSGSNIVSFSGALAFIAAVLCMQAKSGLAPFDISESDQELMGGVLIEYSGLLLAGFKLMKAILIYTVPLLIIILFMGKDTSLVFILLKYLMLLVVMVLIKNTNPRLRIDQAMRFFWRLPSLFAVVAVALAIFGI